MRGRRRSLLLAALTVLVTITSACTGTDASAPSRSNTTTAAAPSTPRTAPSASASPSAACTSKRPTGATAPRLDQKTDGPYFHSIWIGRLSADGKMVAQPSSLREHASVPDGVRLPDGSTAIYYVNGATGGIDRAVWDGSTLSPAEPITIDGVDSGTAVDPDVSLAADGSVRLAFFSGFGPPTPGRPAHVMCVAGSRDGKSFTDARAIYQGDDLTDPSLIVDGDRWTLAVSQGRRSIVAVSTDGGATFRDVATLTGGVPELARRADGRGLLAFTCDRGISVWASDELAATWTATGGLQGLPPGGSCDPSVVAGSAGADGSSLFVFKMVAPGRR